MAVLGSMVSSVLSLLVWLLLLGTPLVLLGLVFYCAARGTGSLAGTLVDATAKKVREYQRQQMKKDKQEPSLPSMPLCTLLDIPQIKAAVTACLSNHDLTSAIRVSHQWRDWFMPALWKNVVEVSFRPLAPPRPSDVGFRLGLAKYGHRSLQSLTVATEHRLDAYLDHCRNLVHLRLFFPMDLKLPSSPDLLNRLITLNPSLQTVAITAPLFVLRHASFATLTHLSSLLLNRVFVNLPELVQLLALSPHLATLGLREVILGPRLSYPDHIDDQALSNKLLTHLACSSDLQPMSPSSSSSSPSPCLHWKEYPRMRELSFWTPMEALDLWLLCRLLEHSPNLASLTFSLGEEQGLFPALCQGLQHHARHLRRLTITAGLAFKDGGYLHHHPSDNVSATAAAAAAQMVAACHAKPLESIRLHDYFNPSREQPFPPPLPQQPQTQQYPLPILELDRHFATTLRLVRLYNFVEEADTTWFPRLVQACHGLEVLDMRFPLSSIDLKDVALATWNCRRLRKLDLVLDISSSSSRTTEQDQQEQEPSLRQDKWALEPLSSYHHQHHDDNNSTLENHLERPMDRVALEHLFFEKLAGLRHLEVLSLKGPRGYKGQDNNNSMDLHLALTLESGLGLLSGLGSMQEFRVVSMNHALGQPERQWIKVHWPRLCVCEICPPTA